MAPCLPPFFEREERINYSYLPLAEMAKGREGPRLRTEGRPGNRSLVPYSPRSKTRLASCPLHLPPRDSVVRPMAMTPPDNTSGMAAVVVGANEFFWAVVPPSLLVALCKRRRCRLNRAAFVIWYG